MSGIEMGVLFVAALATSALTAVAGAGGGLILLVVILQFVDPLVAVPAHGVIQLFSNGTRAVTLRHDVDRSLLGPYLVPLLPAAGVGYLIADALPRNGGRALIGMFALAAVWLPAATRWLAPKPGRGGRFALVGVVAGVTNPPFGAVGPLLAPAFKAAARSHVEFVGTFSVAQTLNHLAKIAVFAIAGYAWSEHLGVMVVGVAGVIVGTRVGARALHRIQPDVLDGVFKIAVTAGAMRLILGWVV